MSFANEEPKDEAFFAKGRLAGKVYASKSFPFPWGEDKGKPARYIYQVFDPDIETSLELSGEEYLVKKTPKGRYQTKFLVAREAGAVKEIWIQKFTNSKKSPKLETLLNLQRQDASRLIDLVKLIDWIPPDEGKKVRLDKDIVTELLSNPESLTAYYNKAPSLFRQLIEEDVAAGDVIALAARKKAVLKFRKMLDDDRYFDSLVTSEGKGKPETVWQVFFECNPWILGVSTSSQILTEWSNDRLEQVVAGSDIKGAGKRVDALMRTAGQIRALVFLEIKTHRTDLLEKTADRPGCFAPSRQLSRGISQIQGTVHRAVDNIGETLTGLQDDGSENPLDLAYLIRPRSLLIAGQLSQLKGVRDGHHVDKIRSFELFRRSLSEPDVLTYDELYAKAAFIANA